MLDLTGYIINTILIVIGNADCLQHNILIYFTVLVISSKSDRLRRRRSTFQYPLSSGGLQIGGIDVDTFGLTQPGAPVTLDLTLQQQQQQLQGQSSRQQVNLISSNDIEKPVDEIQEFVPSQTQGGQTAIIPSMPPRATPVQLTSPNTAANRGAVFLGSGALGVVGLGGDVYVLGSGGLGYSNRRSNPRASFMHPMLPPVRASADLIPAAVNTAQLQQLQGIQFSYPPGNQLPQDQNGYEYLPPDRVAFGDPLPPRPLKTTNSYATPTPDQQLAIGVQRLENFNSQLYGISQQLY